MGSTLFGLEQSLDLRIQGLQNQIKPALSLNLKTLHKVLVSSLSLKLKAYALLGVQDVLKKIVPIPRTRKLKIRLRQKLVKWS